MPMETRHDLEHTTERLTEGLRCPWKWGHIIVSEVKPIFGHCNCLDVFAPAHHERINGIRGTTMIAQKAAGL